MCGIIYGKNFFAFERFNKNDKKSTNTRIYSLLNTFNSAERICSSLDDVKKNSKNKIDFSRIKNIISEEKEKSISFIKNAVK